MLHTPKSNLMVEIFGLNTEKLGAFLVSVSSSWPSGGSCCWIGEFIYELKVLISQIFFDESVERIWFSKSFNLTAAVGAVIFSLQNFWATNFDVGLRVKGDTEHCALQQKLVEKLRVFEFSCACKHEVVVESSHKRIIISSSVMLGGRRIGWVTARGAWVEQTHV